ERASDDLWRLCEKIKQQAEDVLSRNEKATLLRVGRNLSDFVLEDGNWVSREKPRRTQTGADETVLESQSVNKKEDADGTMRSNWDPRTWLKHVFGISV